MLPRLRAERRELREIDARVLVEGRREEVAIATPHGVSDRGDGDRPDERECGKPLRARACDKDVQRQRGERREDRVLLGEHGEPVADESRREEPRVARAHAARE